MTQMGVCVEKNSRFPGFFGFIHSNILELFLGQLPERQRNQRVILTMSPEDRSSSCWRFEKLTKMCQTSQSPE